MKKRLGAVFLLTMLPIFGWLPFARAQQISMPVYAPPIAPHTIEVVGRGEVRVAPDLASLDFAIETHAKTADQAASDNAQLAQKVMQALQSKLGDKGKVWTLGYTLTPDYSDKPGEQTPKIIGYRAANSVHVETGAIDMTGGLIDAAIGAGANRVDSIDFGLRDESKARNEAITKAAKDAQTQAQTLANALGVKLKGVFRATTEGEERPMPRMARAVNFAAAANVPTPIQPNQVTVPATVSLAYEIE
ncbi:MAG TPA: SIMPL domain-containing protein [Candidatus Binataceae bacterium]|nr:SIMPL domain-containing protein [Candidatus Binataceae bacterium]